LTCLVCFRFSSHSHYLSVAFQRLWVDCLDYKREESTTVFDFFDHVLQPKSTFGLWLFDAANVNPDEMVFSQYISVTAYAALLSKPGLLKLIFDHSSITDCLSRDGWKTLVKAILSVEKVPYPRRIAIEAFDRFSSKDIHGNDVLLFEDFVQLSNHYPFVIMPMVRLLKSIREHHLGDSFWRLKTHEIEKAHGRIREEEEGR